MRTISRYHGIKILYLEPKRKLNGPREDVLHEGGTSSNPSTSDGPLNTARNNLQPLCQK